MAQPLYDDQNNPDDPNDVVARIERERLAGAIGEDTDTEGSASHSVSGRGGSDSSPKKSSKDGGFYNPNHSDNNGGVNTSQNQTSGESSKWSTFSKGMRGRVGPMLNNKWLVGAGVGMGGILGLVIMLLILMFALKIPHLMENITTYQFARVFQRANVQNDRTIRTHIAVAAANKIQYDQLKERWAGEGSKTKATFDRIDKMRPNKIIRNLNASGMTFNYDGRKLTSITMDGNKKAVPTLKMGQKLIPGARFANNAKIAAAFGPDLEQALRANEIGPIARGVVYSKIRQQLGIGLVAWTAGKYAGKSREDITRGINQDTAKAVESDASSKPKTSDLAKAAQEATEAEKAGLADPDQVDDAIKNSGVIKKTQQSVASVTDTTPFKTALGVGNPIYAIAVPICIVYDGSISNAGDTIDANSTRQIKAFSQYSTVQSQMQDGLTSDSAVVGAYSDKLGDINGTPPMNVASGKNPGTRIVTSPQASSSGGFTAFNAIFGGDSDTAGAANWMANKFCPVATNLWVGIVTGFANIAAMFASGGTSQGAAQAAGRVATGTVTRVAERSVSRFGITNILQQSTKASKFIGRQAVEAGSIAAITIVSRQIVANSADAYNNGLEQGKEQTAILDSGGNLMANEIMRQQQYGRPLNKTETKAAIAQNKSFVIAQNKSQSTFGRYLAISNPNSLLTQFGSSIATTARFNKISSIVNPNTLLSKLFGGIYLQANAEADGPGYGTTYDNVQWGWTEEEVDLIQNDESYQMFANQDILAASGLEDKLTEEIGPCFTESMGTLLEELKVIRDEDGNVLDEGDCSPKNLSLDSPKYGEMALRWRVAHADISDLTEKENFEEVTNGSEASSGDSSGGTTLKIATYNIRVAGQVSSGRGSAPLAERAARAAKLIDDKEIDVVGFQETLPDTRVVLNKSLTGFDSFPKIGEGKGKSAVTPIYWRSSHYRQVDQGFIGRVWLSCNGIQLCDSTPWVKLEDVNTGQTMYVVSSHFLNEVRGEGNGGGPQREASAQAITAWSKGLPEDSAVILLGDYNSDYRPADDDVDIGRNVNRLPYCIFTRAGFVDSYDAVKGNGGDCPSKNKSHNELPYRIDHVYVSDAIADYVKSEDRIHNADTMFISDHDPTVATIVIPGPADQVDGASKEGWVWPISKEDFTGVGQCWNNVYNGGRHAGVDLRAESFTKVYAAHDGVVVSYKFNTYGGNTLIVNAKNGLWYNYQHLESSTVEAGDEVKAGYQVALSDNTGSSTTGAHLHFGVAVSATTGSYSDNTQTRNPLDYLPTDRSMSPCK